MYYRHCHTNSELESNWPIISIPKPNSNILVKKKQAFCPGKTYINLRQMSQMLKP